MVLAEVELRPDHPGALNPDHVLRANDALRTLARYASPTEAIDGRHDLHGEFRRVQLPMFQAIADAAYATLSGDRLTAELLEIGEASRTAQIESSLADACERLETPLSHTDLLDQETIVYPVVGQARTYILLGRRDGWNLVVGDDSSGADPLARSADALVLQLPLSAANWINTRLDEKTPWAQEESHFLFARLIAPLVESRGGTGPLLLLGNKEDEHPPTLIFFPDPVLRNVPWALLSPTTEPGAYLVHSAAIAVEPGLAYVRPPTPRRRGRLLLAGFDASGGSDPGEEGLMEFIDEAATARNLTSLVGAAFTGDGLINALSSGEYSAVLVASHARFEPGGSIITVYGDRAPEDLKIGDIERALRNAGRRARTLDLLILVACEGATGDAGDLGIAGAALRGGAVTTIGSLTRVPAETAPWYFYRDPDLGPSFLHLYYDSRLSPAQALRRSQIASVAEQDFPPSWGVFVVIGGWR
jgi:hypothetical protein